MEHDVLALEVRHVVEEVVGVEPQSANHREAVRAAQETGSRRAERDQSRRGRRDRRQLHVDQHRLDVAIRQREPGDASAREGRRRDVLDRERTGDDAIPPRCGVVDVDLERGVGGRRVHELDAVVAAARDRRVDGRGGSAEGVRRRRDRGLAAARAQRPAAQRGESAGIRDLPRRGERIRAERRGEVDRVARHDVPERVLGLDLGRHREQHIGRRGLVVAKDDEELRRVARRHRGGEENRGKSIHLGLQHLRAERAAEAPPKSGETAGVGRDRRRRSGCAVVDHAAAARHDREHDRDARKRGSARALDDDDWRVDGKESRAPGRGQPALCGQAAGQRRTRSLFTAATRNHQHHQSTRAKGTENRTSHRKSSGESGSRSVRAGRHGRVR